MAVVEECSIALMKKLGIDANLIISKVDQSFEEEDNQLLRQLSEQKESSNIIYFPSVVVNNILYRGNL